MVRFGRLIENPGPDCAGVTLNSALRCSRPSPRRAAWRARREARPPLRRFFRAATPTPTRTRRRPSRLEPLHAGDHLCAPLGAVLPALIDVLVDDCGEDQDQSPRRFNTSSQSSSIVNLKEKIARRLLRPGSVLADSKSSVVSAINRRTSSRSTRGSTMPHYKSRSQYWWRPELRGRFWLISFGTVS
jgi:hypothetical protein